MVRFTPPAALLLLATLSAEAATRTWTGTSSNLWSVAANWGGTAPVAGDTLLFPVDALNKASTNDFPPATSFASIQIEGGAYSLSGAAITLTGGFTSAHVAGLNRLSMPITLSGAQTFTNWMAGTLVEFTGTIDIGPYALTSAGNGHLRFVNSITGTTGGVVVNGPGSVGIAAPVSYSGTTFVNSGGLYVTAGGTLGNITISSPTHLGGGLVADDIVVGDTSFTVSPGGTPSVTAQTFVMHPWGTFSVVLDGTVAGESGRLALSGPLNLGWGMDPTTSSGANFPVAPRHVWTIIDKLSVGPVTGTFYGCPEGCVFRDFNRLFRVSYAGGDGNDVTLTQMEARGDISGDLKGDVFWRHDSTGANSVWFMDGLGIALSATMPLVADSNWKVAALGDFQGDGKTDVFWRNSATGATVVWLLNGGTVAASAILPAVPNPNWVVAAAGDFQGDGKTDLFWRNTVSGANVIWFMNGLSVAVAVPTTAVPAVFQIGACGDFQADGIADIVWRNPSTGANVVWLMSGATVVVSGMLPTVADANWKIAGAGDLQGDAKSDLIWRHDTTGANAVWFMDGLAPAATATLPPVPDPNCKIVKIEDFQADAQADILWHNAVTGGNSIWLMNGTAVAASAALPAVPDTNWKPAGTP